MAYPCDGVKHTEFYTRTFIVDSGLITADIADIMSELIMYFGKFMHIKNLLNIQFGETDIFIR